MSGTNIHDATKLIEPAGEQKLVRKPGSMKGKIKILPGFHEADKEIEEMFNSESGRLS